MRNHLLAGATALPAALSVKPALARPMTEVDLATMKRVAAPAASPDGRWVAFQITETAPESYKRSTGLWLLGRKAKDAKPVRIADVAGKNESSPAFGPDGLLYFISDASGSDQIWRVATDGAAAPPEIGRAPGRERGWQDVWIEGVAGSLKKSERELDT